MAKIIKYIETSSDGEGLRLSCYFSKCSLACIGCHNIKSWDENIGIEFTYEIQIEIINILKNMITPNLTLTGGNPMESSVELLKFVKLAKSIIPKLNIWIYSGFRLDEILRDKDMRNLLYECDVLVDGRFEIDKKDLSLAYRGSSNQKIYKKINNIFIDIT